LIFVDDGFFAGTHQGGVAVDCNVAALRHDAEQLVKRERAILLAEVNADPRKLCLRTSSINRIVVESSIPIADNHFS
jgi:hypothetical protein